ncbi:MAG TPA: nuclear transport factor 2 family protein [Panacibacter sp.]|nr:nuclear transport factor 2 family protein [Panacibacter sp.]
MTNKETVQQMYADFGQGNITGILNVISDDIIWDTPGPRLIPWAGVRRGKAGAIDFFQQVGSSTTYEKFEPQTFIEEADTVVASGVGHFTTKTTGKKGISPWIMVWTFKDGVATQVKNHWDTYAIAETFML